MARLGSIPLIFCVALLLRAGWVCIQWQRVGAGLEWDDEHLHWQLATNLVTRFEMVTDDGRFAARMPLYPAFLAPFALAGDAGVLLARLAQGFLGAATAWVAARFARRYLGAAAGALAGWLVCFDPYGVFFANLLLSEVLFTFLAVGTAATAACTLSAINRDAGRGAASKTGSLPDDGHDRIRWLPLALLCASCIHARPSAAGWIVAIWVLILTLGRDRRSAFRIVAACAMTFALTLAPWGLRNQQVIGHPAWLSANGGITLYDALGPQADGSSNQAFLRERPELAGLGEAVLDRKLRDMAMAQISADPAIVIRLAGVKFLRTWNPFPNVEGYRGGWSGRISAAYTIVVLVLAIIGCSIAFLGRSTNAGGAKAPFFGAQRRFVLICLSPVVVFTLIHCVYIGSVRYRVPLMPFLCLAAAPLMRARTGGEIEHSAIDR